MPRYFFDVHDADVVQQDDVGVELSGLHEVRKAAMQALPGIARDEVPTDGSHRSFMVVVMDEQRQPVYVATLNFSGYWLPR